MGGGKADRRSGAARYEPVLFAIVVIAQAIPLLVLRYFPNEDGPGHVGAGEILSHYDGALRHYFSLSFFTPNLTSDVLAAGLLRALSPAWTGRVLLALVILGTPFAARYFFSVFGSLGKAISWLMIPLTMSWFLHLGLFNFCLGVVLFFLTIGFWWRRDDPGAGATAILGGLLLLLLLTHPVPLAMALLFLAAGAIGAQPPASWPTSRAHLWRRVKPLLLAAVVPTVLLGVYYVTQPGESTSRLPLNRLIRNLFTLYEVVVSFRDVEDLAALLLAATVGCLFIYVLIRAAPRRLLDPAHILLGLAGLIVALYLVLPNSATRGGGDLSSRLSFFAYLALLAWIAQFRVSSRVRTVTSVAAVVVAGGLMAIRLPVYWDFDRELRDYMSVASQLPRDATVVPINLLQDGQGGEGLAQSCCTRPTLQASSWLMAERHVVDLSHFESYFGVYAPNFRDELDPFASIGRGQAWIDQSTPDVDLLGYEAFTGGRGRIDYVLVWGRSVASPEVLADPLTADLDRQLAEGYQLVFTSPRGLLQLYQRQPG